MWLTSAQLPPIDSSRMSRASDPPSLTAQSVELAPPLGAVGLSVELGDHDEGWRRKRG